MSSAILYLAIVAIWACVLVPRWLRRPHDTAPESEVPSDEAEAVFYAEAPDHRDYGTEAELARSRSAPPAGSGLPPRAARPSRYAPARPPAPGSDRARVLQARRRMFTTLVVLAAAALVCAATGFTSLWTAIPPVGMLLAYLLLLREAGRADAEAARRAESYARYARAQAAPAAYERAREAQAHERAAPLPQPAAEVIDISDRTAEAADQLYDQYNDATIRAVGD